MKKNLRRILFILFPVLVIFGSGCYVQKDYHVNRAGEYYINGEIDKGIAELEMALKENPNNARAHYNLGNFNLELGNFVTAIESYIKATELYPKYAGQSASVVGIYPKYYEALDNLAMTYLVIGNYKEALILTEESSKPGYDNDQPLHTSCLAHILSGDAEEGLKLFNYFKKRNRNKNQIKNDSLLITLFIDKKLSENALLSYLKASVTTSSPSRGLQYLQPALDEDPENSVFIELRNQYNDPEYLAKKCESARLRNDYLSAVNYAQNGNFKGALKIIDELVIKEPDNISYLELQSMLSFELGRKDESVQICKRILKINPEAPGTWYNLGNLYTRIDSLKQAEASFLKALEKDSEYPEANAYLGTIYWLRDGDYEKAMAYYKKELDINPKNEETYFNAAKLCYRKENYVEAEKYLIQLVSLNPFDMPARAMLIDTYVIQGYKDKAKNLVNETLGFLEKEKAPKDMIKYFEKRRIELQ